MERTEIKTGKVVSCEASFSSKPEINLASNNAYELYYNMKENILDNIAMNISEHYLEMQVRCETSSTHGSVCAIKGHLLPPNSREVLLRKKKAINNLQNEDDECFKWCITHAMYLTEKKIKNESTKLWD